MTKIVEQALKKLSKLPEEKQEIIASFILKQIEKETDSVTEAERTETESNSSLPPSIGMGASGRTDLSTRCDELLWQEK